MANKDEIHRVQMDGVHVDVYRNKHGCLTIDVDTSGADRDEDHHDAADTMIPRLRLFVNEELSYINEDGSWTHMPAIDEEPGS